MKNKLFALALCSVLAAGCKQGRGDRCQVDSDCESPLICSHAEPKTCGDGTGEGIDAAVPPADATAVAP